MKTTNYFKSGNWIIHVIFLCWFSIQALMAQEIIVQAGNPVTDVKLTMWGVFFEDINFAADGGIYAELVKNRSFEFSLPMMGWNQVRMDGNGRTLPTFYSPENPVNPHFLEVIVDAPAGSFGIVNEGFRGMGIKKDETYSFSANVRVGPNSSLRMKVELVSSTGKVIGNAEITGLTNVWKKQAVTIKATETDPKSRLRILWSGKGVADIDLLSLFPSTTWKNRPGGLRSDIVQLIADLKPGFFRFPGGCIVEGRNLANRYQWKTTVGPVDERKLIMNRWSVEVKNRQTPDYYQSFGLGFYEYFQLAEDMEAEPLPVINCGMSCQFNAGEIVPLSDLNPYIQDALDLVEFANGGIATKWGKLRSSMGHPKPFNLKYLAVGNEQWDVQYIERYKEFEKAIKTKYPEIKIVSGSGPSAEGPLFDYAWSELRKLSPALIDEHYYMPPDWFLKNAGRYDSYDRKGIKVFAGEYAARGKEGNEPESGNTWLSALAEAAFMTGLERNADIVNMASYAPLLAHADAWQWRPDLIWFDNLNAIGSANYYVQKIFSNYKGTQVIPVLSRGKPVSGQDSLYASATFDKNAGKAYIKLINVSRSAKYSKITLDGPSFGTAGVWLTLKSDGPDDFNSMSDPQHIFPTGRQIEIINKKIDISMSPISVNVLILSVKK
jgi:alpha-L-arabinofuranosidase